MPRVSELSLPPLNWGKESIGQRVAHIRQERGFTQVELAAKTGVLQTLVTDYETDRLRLTAGWPSASPWRSMSRSMSCCIPTPARLLRANPAAKCSPSGED